VRYAVAAMLNEVAADSRNVINGLSISPKKTHNIVKVWNSDCKTFKNKMDLVQHHPEVLAEETIYTPFTEKKM
jgi:hypothetical protein